VGNDVAFKVDLADFGDHWRQRGHVFGIFRNMPHDAPPSWLEVVDGRMIRKGSGVECRMHMLFMIRPLSHGARNAARGR
jgi:hypothetical protein